eukprot:m.51107 g.51107  ORF g.51107 m.51107 type:complete len:534 (+) comp10710_c0_seq1:180-1781(+)
MDTDQINYLIYRYLQESGFEHSSFTFGQESGVTRCSIAGTKIPPGSLITQLQKALNYVQAEICLLKDGTPANLEDLAGVEALTLLESVQPEVCNQRRRQLWDRRRDAQQTHAVKNEEGKAEEQAVPEKAAKKAKKEHQHHQKQQKKQQHQEQQQQEQQEQQQEDGEAMEVDVEVPASRIQILQGHENHVFSCSWNPKCELLASASGDSTARIWNLEGEGTDDPIVLQHTSPDGDDAAEGDTKDVSTLDWRNDGELLATGASDSIARIWTKTGALRNRLIGHGGPIFSLKWNSRGDYLVTSSSDCSAIVWDAEVGQIKQKFSFHTAPCLDVDWRNAETFASCSQDMCIYVCQVGSFTPIRKFNGGTGTVGHTDEVNAIKWDQSGKHLASCSDDFTAKIWGMEEEVPLHTLSQGGKIYSLIWSTPPKGSDVPLMLASASFDNTVKVWDAILGKCLYTLSGHTFPVYSVGFSPDSRFLASGASDNLLLLWSMENGELIQSYQGGAGIYEVCWNRSGKRIAACFADNTVSVLQFVES